MMINCGYNLTMNCDCNNDKILVHRLKSKDEARAVYILLQVI